MVLQQNNNNRPYVLWRRVSTREQGDSRLGLDAQLAFAEHFMRRSPEQVYTEVYTGTKLNECKQLWAAIKHCKESGDLLVIAKTDRFRNVREALSILEELGEGNLCFCDIPTTDKFVLTVVFAMCERQAIMGRINTKLALDERRKQAAEYGYWVSKAGNVCTQLGRQKGTPIPPAAVEAASLKRTRDKIEWRETSVAYKWAMARVAAQWERKMIIEEFNKLHELQPDVFCTRKGGKLTRSILCQWIMASDNGQNLSNA